MKTAPYKRWPPTQPSEPPAVQLDLLELFAAIDEPEPDLPQLAARRIFTSHARRYALLRHQRGELKRDEMLAATVGEHSGGGGTLHASAGDQVAGGWFSWTARRSGVDIEWNRGDGHHQERLTWPAVIAAALRDLTPTEAADLDAAETERRAVRVAADAKFDRLALHYDDGSPVVWVAPYDTSGGLKAGTAVPGARCWLCGDVEPNTHLLDLNHGLAPYYPESLERDMCAMQDRAARRDEVAAT